MHIYIYTVYPGGHIDFLQLFMLILRICSGQLISFSFIISFPVIVITFLNRFKKKICCKCPRPFKHIGYYSELYWRLAFSATFHVQTCVILRCFSYIFCFELLVGFLLTSSFHIAVTPLHQQVTSLPLSLSWCVAFHSLGGILVTPAVLACLHGHFHFHATSVVWIYLGFFVRLGLGVNLFFSLLWLLLQHGGVASSDQVPYVYGCCLHGKGNSPKDSFFLFSCFNFDVYIRKVIDIFLNRHKLQCEVF